jgi:glucose/arabinose dehydrogenase
MDLDGSNLEVYARGVRNSVGFDWHPSSGELWFTDNGRDLLGDNIPPEELNVVTTAGQHFGFPYRYGKTILDNEFTTTMGANEFTPAILEMPAHNAGLGIDFYNGDRFPATYTNQLFAAYHGSWNRDPIDGYKIRLMRFENNKAVSFEDFATGWLQDNSYWGRPVDVEQTQDGSLLVSDDFNGVIYRISYAE